MTVGKRFPLTCVLVCLAVTAGTVSLSAAPVQPPATPTVPPAPTPSAAFTAVPVAPVAPLPTPTPVPSIGNTGPDHLLDYEQALSARSNRFEVFVENQTEAHRLSLENFYSKIVWVVGIVVTVIGVLATVVVTAFSAIVGYHNRRDVKTVKEEISSQFRNQLDVAVKTVKEEISSKFRNELDEVVKKEVGELRGQIAALKIELGNQIDLTKQATEKDFNLVAEYASIISHAAVVLSVKPPIEPQEIASIDRERALVITRLKSLQDKVPRHRTFNIFLARLYRARGDFRTAIAELSNVIKDREEKQINTGTDHAALLFNRACYRNLLAAEPQEHSQSGQLREEAWKDLQICVQLWPEDWEEMKEDQDLKGLVGSDPSRASWEQLLAFAKP